jgi:hypothetical protein
MNNDLMQKLMVAKKIMDVADQKPRGSSQGTGLSTPMVESFNAAPATYNIPQEFIGEQKVEQPVSSGPVTKDRILNSKLPDEIKRLMIEHPIEQPQQFNNTSVLSNEMVEKASRLMNTNAAGKVVKEQVTSKSTTSDLRTIQQVVRETVEQVLSENGLLIESTQKTKDQISFRVGQHIFEGVVTKIKKVK